MKKLLRLRHWLIKKLGGYTEQHIFAPRTDVRISRVAYLPITSETVIAPDLIRDRCDEIHAYEVVKCKLAADIAHTICEQGLMTVECTEDMDHGLKRLYRARVYLIPPGEVAKMNL